jgi:hypothetical protein
VLGRRKRDGNHSPQKKSLIQDSEGNEENRFPILDPKKTKINNTKEPSDAHKNTLKEEILQVITENFMKKLDVVNHIVQDVLKKFQDTKNKEYENTQNK